ncbi:hypothetical protein HAX54_006760 [Datura stramonium]|uniref:Retrotransposon gag domain-containing protein n=1 Tax=Datura stramonium TaxID=4076 RepID=A0ABS8WUA3_DATST|nr:hypothetical protein [Datura stramonium]
MFSEQVTQERQKPSTISEIDPNGLTPTKEVQTETLDGSYSIAHLVSDCLIPASKRETFGYWVIKEMIHQVMNMSETEDVEFAFYPAKSYRRFRQNDISVQEYSLGFVRLARYTTKMVSTMQTRVRRFMIGLRPQLIDEFSKSTLIEEIDPSSIMAYAR